MWLVELVRFTHAEDGGMGTKMSKASLIRLLYSERCSISEISLATGSDEWNVTRFIRYNAWPNVAFKVSERHKTFNSWRGWPLSDKVVSF